MYIVIKKPHLPSIAMIQMSLYPLNKQGSSFARLRQVPTR